MPTRISKRLRSAARQLRGLGELADQVLRHIGDEEPDKAERAEARFQAKYDRLYGELTDWWYEASSRSPTRPSERSRP